MSTNGNDNHSGSPDVEEPNSSNPSSARQRGRRDNNNPASRQRSSPDAQGSPSVNTTSTSNARGRGGGKSGGRTGKKWPKQKDHSQVTLMRTNSAPPDEHAGILEVGGNGLRKPAHYSSVGQHPHHTGSPQTYGKPTAEGQQQPGGGTSSPRGAYLPKVWEEGLQTEQQVAPDALAAVQTSPAAGQISPVAVQSIPTVGQGTPTMGQNTPIMGQNPSPDSQSSFPSSDSKRPYEKQRTPHTQMSRGTVHEQFSLARGFSPQQAYYPPRAPNVRVNHTPGMPGGVVMDSGDARNKMPLPHNQGVALPVPVMPHQPYQYISQVVPQQPPGRINGISPPIQHTPHSYSSHMYFPFPPNYSPNFPPNSIHNASPMPRNHMVGMPGDPHRNNMPNRFMNPSSGSAGLYSYSQQPAIQQSYMPMLNPEITNHQHQHMPQQNKQQRPYSQQSQNTSVEQSKKQLSLKDKSGNAISLQDLKGDSSRGGGSGTSSPQTPASKGQSPVVRASGMSPATSTAPPSASASPTTFSLPNPAVPPPTSSQHQPEAEKCSTVTTDSPHSVPVQTHRISSVEEMPIPSTATADPVNAVDDTTATNVKQEDVNLDESKNESGRNSDMISATERSSGDKCNVDCDQKADSGSDVAKPIVDLTAFPGDELSRLHIDQGAAPRFSNKIIRSLAENKDSASETDIKSDVATVGESSRASSETGNPLESDCNNSTSMNAKFAADHESGNQIQSNELTWEDEPNTELKTKEVTTSQELSSTSAPVPEKKSKKSLRKDKLAAADSLQRDMLDAYTSKPTPAPVSTEPTKPTPPPLAAQPTAEPVPMESWEEQATKMEIKPAVRSLRPQGQKLNTGARAGPAAPLYVYSKAEILKLKVPKEQMDCPSQCLSYSKIVVTSDNPQGAKNGPSGGKLPYAQQMSGQGGPEPRWKQGGYPQQQPSMQYDDKQAAGWKRGQQQAPTQQQRNPRRVPAPPMPKKVITDPVEVMTREVVAILNKITPQTFLKLTNQLADINILSSEMLERFTRLVFDKAVNEPNFANLYAEMCSILDSKNNYLSFCQVVWNKDTNQYLWIVDMQYSNTLSGPFSTVEECVNAAVAVSNHPTQPVNSPVNIVDILIVNGILINIFNAVDRAGYFVAFMPFADIDESKKSGTFFPSREAAIKSISKKYGFKTVLVRICQDEYMASVSNDGYYATPTQRREKLKREKASMTADEIALAELELEELEGAVKRRMFGNIRFIGELCKKGMIRNSTMFECIRELLFGKSVGDQEVELVCKLLRTVGGRMESSLVTDKPENEKLQEMRKENRKSFKSFFLKLSELAGDKRVNSRIRFSIEEIIALRKNAWQERREADGPALIEEIRMKAANEEQMKRQQMQSQANPRYQKGGKGRGGTQSPQDSRMGAGGRGGGHQPGHVRRNSPHSVPSPADIRRVGADSPNQSRYGTPPSAGRSQRGPVEQLPPDVLKRKTNTIVDEYLSMKDSTEANECLAELPMNACGEIVLRVVDKYLNCNKSDMQRDLVQFLNCVMPQLKVGREHVESSLSKCEDLRLLVDNVVDIMNAPEWLGAVVNVLIQGEACRRQVIDQTLLDVREDNKNDEFGKPDEEVVAIHQRFLSSLS